MFDRSGLILDDKSFCLCPRGRAAQTRAPPKLDQSDSGPPVKRPARRELLYGRINIIFVITIIPIMICAESDEIKIHLSPSNARALLATRYSGSSNQKLATKRPPVRQRKETRRPNSLDLFARCHFQVSATSRRLMRSPASGLRASDQQRPAATQFGRYLARSQSEPNSAHMEPNFPASLHLSLGLSEWDKFAIGRRVLMYIKTLLPLDRNRDRKINRT